MHLGVAAAGSGVNVANVSCGRDEDAVIRALFDLGVACCDSEGRFEPLEMF